VFRIRLGSGSAIGSYGPTRMSSIQLYKTQMCNVTVFFCDSLDPNPSLRFRAVRSALLRGSETLHPKHHPTHLSSPTPPKPSKITSKFTVLSCFFYQSLIFSFKRTVCFHFGFLPQYRRKTNTKILYLVSKNLLLLLAHSNNMLSRKKSF
jgi:hypothetical protein